MLYLLYQTFSTEEEFADKYGRTVMSHTDAYFETFSRRHDLNSDNFLIECLREIDLCDVPFPNVIRDIPTGTTHSFDKISGGVKTLWLMYHYSDKFVFPSRFFGENCYRIVVELSKTKDIYIYDDADMCYDVWFSKCNGDYTDVANGAVIKCSESFDYACDKSY